MLFLFLFAYFPLVVLATPVVTVSSFPPSVVAGEKFSPSFNISGLSLSSSYFMKALGGNSFSEVDTWNSSWLQQNADWTSMPSFTSDSDGNAQTTIECRFDPATATGSKEFKVRIRKADIATNYDSSPVTVSVLDATPTVSPTATPTTKTPTLTQSPSPTPAKSIYKINPPKDGNNQLLTGVKIYIDNLYTHHEDGETLEFCTGCFCDNDKLVPCGPGEHTTKLIKAGYSEWSEQRNFSPGGNYEISPIFSPVPTSVSTTSSIQTPTPTTVKTPTPTPFKTLTPTLVIARLGTPNQSNLTPSVSSPSSILGIFTDSTISSVVIGDLPAGRQGSDSDAAIQISQFPPSNHALSLPNSVLKYTFIFGVIISSLAGGVLYFRHRSD
ncbi:MAG: hypothetical protein UW41_C0003G0038 [Candidatus Collierbacteria bacterium GW2011_GWC2_44_18]|uniref:Uncharacterized protein n=1 Tax=Candidatus Collierbacteria bacterium GW2011_GWC2_44_18 TaxID=1618392 RepID=A0A0G1HRA2_9BACT|nr:MAG: hypothetical protein UW41_C0003G0038 [Candidatus Collierbacteria bacterium GW2011_GWC2_44_18]